MRRMLLVAAAALTAAGQTQIDLRTQARQVDFSAAAATRPVKTGTELPTTCAVGEMFFKVDAPAGMNVYGCSEQDRWSLQSGSLTIASDGAAVGSRTRANFRTGPGMISLISDTGDDIEVGWALDTAVVQTVAGEQSGAARLCVSDGGSALDYRCRLNPPASSYVTGMVLHWKPDVSGAGGPTTLNVDTLGAVRIKLRDGVSDPSPVDIMAGQLYAIWYDGDQFRLMMPTAGTMPGSVTWETLAGKPAAFAPSPHAAGHQHDGGDEIATATPTPNAIPKAGSDGKLDAGWLSAAAGGLGYTAENVAHKGQANGYAPLDSGAKVPISHLPSLPYQPELGFTPENSAHKGQPNGYASLDSTGKVPAFQIPAVPAAVQTHMLVFDGSTTTLSDGSTVSWTCGTGSGAQCTTTWTVPEGVRWIRVEAWGGGAGGMGGIAQYGGGGGGGGGYMERTCPVAPGASIAISTGLGGTGIGGYGSTNAGGDSSVESCVSVMGGRSWSSASGGPGGFPAGWPLKDGVVPFGYQSIGSPSGFATATSGSGGVPISPFLGGFGGAQADSGAAGKVGGFAYGGGGGGGGGGHNNAAGGTGGVSILGGAGGNGGGYTPEGGHVSCTDGSAPGGGGGGGGVGTASPVSVGCAGARGEVRVFYAH